MFDCDDEAVLDQDILWQRATVRLKHEPAPDDGPAAHGVDGVRERPA
jgi:hypothetical protein